jgi:hypothetical protein
LKENVKFTVRKSSGFFGLYSSRGIVDLILVDGQLHKTHTHPRKMVVEDDDDDDKHKKKIPGKRERKR